MAISPSALAGIEFNVTGDLKVLLPIAVKLAIGVVVSSVIIAILLWFCKLFLDKKNAVSTDSKADKFTCEIDDTNTVDEAINTFFVINK